MTSYTSPDKTTTKKGAKIAWVVSVLIILYGLVIWSYSAVGSIALVLAGLLLLPPLKNTLLARLNGFLAKPIWLNATSIVLLAIGVSLSGTAITDSNLAEWKENKTSITQKLANSIESKRFEEAQGIIRKFQGSVAGDPVFDELKTKYENAKAEYDARMKAEAAAKIKAQMEAEAQAKAAAEAKARAEATAKTISDLTQAEAKLRANGDAYSVGQCLGFIGRNINVNGAQNIDPRQLNYLQENAGARDLFLKLHSEYKHCTSPGVLINECMAKNGATKTQIDLVVGANTGTLIHRKNDRTEVTVMETACWWKPVLK